MTIPQPHMKPEGQMWLIWCPPNPQVGDTIYHAKVGEPIPADHSEITIKHPARRGTTNGNARGSSADRRARRAWMMECYASNIPGLVRCYRCGWLLFNGDDHPDWEPGAQIQFPAGFIALYGTQVSAAKSLTVDRIVPGVQGGTYRRTNIRPACAGCNSETGGALSRSAGKRKK